MPTTAPVMHLLVYIIPNRAWGVDAIDWPKSSERRKTMSKGDGYHGKMLRGDLTRGDIQVEEPGDAVFRRYLGGGRRRKGVGPRHAMPLPIPGGGRGWAG